MKKNFCLILSVFLGCHFSEAQTSKDIFKPSNPQEMRRLTNFDSPAYQAAKLFMHGVNLGNYLEVPPSENWAVTVSTNEFVLMKKEGFDHVRVPIGWQHYAGPSPDFKLSPEIFSRVDFAVTNALANKLAVMINIHHFDELDTNPPAATEEFLQIWKQVAAHYAKFPTQLAFELDNEPHGNATTAVMNSIYAQAIAEIRNTNPQRTIFVEPGRWGNVDELTNLVLPPDDNVIVSVHCYDPFPFTHQGATWAGADVKPLKNIHFPGPPEHPLVLGTNLNLNRWVTNWIYNYNTLPAEKNPGGPSAFKPKIDLAKAWSDYYGFPIHFGEFGAYTKADDKSRANFYSAFRHAAEAQNIGWCIWDWSAGFRYWNKEKNQSMPGMHAALFGQIN